MRFVVAICGYIGSGKSAFADYLSSVQPAQSAHLETSTVVMGLANDFNQALPAQLNLNERSDMVAAGNQALTGLAARLSNMTNRPVAASELLINDAAIDSDSQWYDKLFIYLESLSLHPDWRSQDISTDNKAHYRPLLQWLGGYILYRLDDPLIWYKELFRQIDAFPPAISFIAVTAPRQPAEADFVRRKGGKVVKINRQGIDGDQQEVTEKRIAAITVDAVIDNNGSLSQLAACARKVKADLVADQLASAYAAANFSADA